MIMDKLKKLEMVAKILRKHHGYKYNKKSDYASRFVFKFDKESKCIDIYNADNGENLFLWPEFIAVTTLFELSCYMYYDKYDLKEVVFHIY